MKHVRFIEHAASRLCRRKLDPAWVFETLRSPERTGTDPVHPHRKRSYRRLPERDGRWLRVVIEEGETEIVVVTAFLDRDAESGS